ncbi:uncharacterized protein LOC128221791 [Mya arenaria]|nr:uncharacterized protein LOC128221791 [Mya arenaria]
MSNNRYVSMHISSWYHASVMDRCCLLTLIFDLGLFGFACAAGNQYGTVSVVGPAFVNREVTLKMIPFFPWGCDVEWRCIREGSTTFQTMTGTKVERYSEDGSFFFKWIASIEYENADFYAVCSTNTSIGTSMVSLNMKDIDGKCGALVQLSPVVRGANVELGYFPADFYIQRQTYNTRTWKKNINEIQLRNGSYEEDKISEYFYKLTVFNFDETDEGTYILECNQGGHTESVHLNMQEQPSHPILGPMSLDFKTTECIHVYGGSDVYCITDNRTEPVQVVLLIGQDSFVLAESKVNKGSYRLHNIHKHMAGLSRRNVTCLVSYAALETPYEVHGILCNVEEGSPPELTVPEFVVGENSTAVCEVRNAFPAPAIEIHVGKVFLADVQQTDSYNTSSNMFISRAKRTKTYKTWNGKDMCCKRQSKDDFGFKDVSVCKYISIKYPPSDIFISVNKILKYNNNVSVRYLNMSCETNESNPPCRIEWSSDNDNITVVHSNNWTNGEKGSYLSVSNVLYTVTEDIGGVTITCATKCNHFPSHLYKDYKMLFSDCPTLSLNTTSHVNLCPKTTLTVKCILDGCNAKEQWTLRWEDENSTVIKYCNKTGECLLRLNYTGEVENTYTCTAWKSEEHLINSLTVLSSRTDGMQCQDNDNQTFSPIFRFSVKNFLIGTVVLCGLCIVFAMGRWIFLKRQKVNALNTVEIVENHSDTDTSSENDVIHIRTEGVQYAVVQRQPATQRIETQQPHNDDSLTYAELDINFLQEAHARIPSRRNDMRTEYADIEVSSKQKPAVEDPVYDNASVLI